jgi:hypothetical protein
MKITSFHKRILFKNVNFIFINVTNHSSGNAALLLSVLHPYICIISNQMWRNISCQAYCINIIQKQSTLTENSRFWRRLFFTSSSLSFIIHKNTISVPRCNVTLIFVASSVSGGFNVRIFVSYISHSYCLLQNFQTISGVHRVPYSVGVAGSFPELKRSAREADHASQSSAEVKNECNLTSTTEYASVTSTI